MDGRLITSGARACAAALVVVALARMAQGEEHAAVPVLQFERYQLDNGLEVILHQDHTVPLAYVSVWYHVGGGDDLPGRSGLAHFCEHMMFEGSQHVKPGEHFKILGVAGNPDANATTGGDRTNYFETVPANQLETVLWLESDRMAYLRRALDQERFDNQRAVVRNERRQRYENVAFGAETVTIGQALYPEGHPYRLLTIGLHDDIQAAILDDATTFFRSWYSPTNATLLVAGDFDVAAVKAMVAKWFGSLPGTSRRPAHRVFATVKLTEPHRQIINDPFSKIRRVHYVWPSAKAGTEDDVGLDMLAEVLGRTSTGRAWQALVGQSQLAQTVGAYQYGRRSGGEFHLYFDVRPTSDLAAAETVVAQQIAELVRTGVTAREIKQYVTAREVDLATGLETLQARGETLQSANHYHGDPGAYGWELAVARKATPEGLRNLAARTLGPGRVEMITIPGGP
jgi:zinc protease